MSSGDQMSIKQEQSEIANSQKGWTIPTGMLIILQKMLLAQI